MNKNILLYGTLAVSLTLTGCESLKYANSLGSNSESLNQIYNLVNSSGTCRNKPENTLRVCEVEKEVNITDFNYVKYNLLAYSDKTSGALGIYRQDAEEGKGICLSFREKNSNWFSANPDFSETVSYDNCKKVTAELATGIPISIEDKKTDTSIVGLEFFIKILYGTIEEAKCIAENIDKIDKCF